MKLFSTVRAKTILYTVSLLVLLAGSFFTVFQLFLAKILRENVNEPYQRLVSFLETDPYIRERLLEGCGAPGASSAPAATQSSLDPDEGGTSADGASGGGSEVSLSGNWDQTRNIEVDDRIQFYEVAPVWQCSERKIGKVGVRRPSAEAEEIVLADRFQREQPDSNDRPYTGARSLLRQALKRAAWNRASTLTQFDGDIVLRAGPLSVSTPAPGPACATLLQAASVIGDSISTLAYKVIPQLSQRIQRKRSERRDEQKIEAVLDLYRALAEADGRVLFVRRALSAEKQEALLGQPVNDPYLADLQKMGSEINSWSALDADDLQLKIATGEMERWKSLVADLLGQVSFERTVVGAVDVAISSESLALFRKLRIRFLWISAGVLLAGLLLAGIVSRRISEPLYRLKAGIDRFSMGDLAYRIPGAGRDEVDGLATELNRMAERMGEAERSRRLAAMGLMMGGAAHELKNPIHALTKGLELLARYLEELRAAGAPAEDDPERSHRVAQRLDRMKIILEDGAENLSRMARLVEDILSLARIDASRFEALDLRNLVKEAVDEVCSRGEGEVEFRRDFGHGPVEVLGSPALKLVFTNLVVNAIQAVKERRATEGKGGEVEIKLKNDPPSAARVTIRDDGIGIGSAERDRLFEPFFTTKRVGEGTGLGLFLAHEIVAAHGGRLMGASEGPNRGAIFTVELPSISGEGNAEPVEWGS